MSFDKIINREGSHSVKYDARGFYFGEEDLIPMWVADMDFAVPEFITDALVDRAKHPIYGYTIRPDSYFKSFIDWVQRRHNWEMQKDWILYSPGIVPALNFIVQCFSEQNDKVLIQPPVYHPFFSVVENNQREGVFNPLAYRNNRYEIDFEDLKRKISTGVKLILFSNPHNPVGRAWNRDELEKLGNICIENNVLIVSDEIHSDLVLPGYTHIPMASISDEIAKITITCMAPSKTFNLAGLSTSSVIISDQSKRELFQQYMGKFHISGGNIFGAVASEAAYTYGDHWLDSLLEYLDENFHYLDEYLKTRIPKIKLVPSEATYLAWLDFRGLKLEGDALKSFTIKNARVGFNDGRTFRDGGEGFQRMNLACPKQVLQEALLRLEKAVNKLN
ncbi:MAG: PatB family C-S lyase [Bacteroidales bacterium]|nr:PatB family C-S lyase [Bacteroidales bacterium]